MNNYTLHKLPEGFIITSDEKIIENDTVLYYDYKISMVHRINIDELKLENGGVWRSSCKKIIAQQDQIDFSPLSLEKQKEIGYFDVEKLAKTDCNGLTYKDYEHLCVRGYIVGFQKAQELLSDRIFTLEEVKQSLFDLADMLFNNCQKGITEEDCQKYQNVIIKSLSQPKSWKVEIEMEDNLDEILRLESIGVEPECYFSSKKPKVTNGKIKILKLL